MAYQREGFDTVHWYGGGNEFLMSGLGASEGQIGFADGSVVQAGDEDLQSAIRKHLAGDSGYLGGVDNAAVIRPSLSDHR